MCSYNALNGVPTCASSDLMTKLARETYGFDGYITGDCGAAQDVWTAHAFGGDAAGAAAASITAGMDVDCGSFVAKNGMAALKSSKLTMAALDKAVGHLFRLRIRLGYFDPPEVTPWGNASHSDLNYTDHYDKALKAAREGIVLLEHKRNVLPLSAKTVAISGPNANNSANMQGIDCHGVPPYLINPVEALGKFATTKVSYSLGCAMNSNDTSGFAAAAAEASTADAAVVVVGLDPSVEYEMRDRMDLLLPGQQAGLVAAVRKALGATKPLVLVLMGGGVIDTSAVDDLVDAVLWVGYPGQSGGVRMKESAPTFNFWNISERLLVFSDRARRGALRRGASLRPQPSDLVVSTTDSLCDPGTELDFLAQNLISREVSDSHCLCVIIVTTTTPLILHRPRSMP